VPGKQEAVLSNRGKSNFNLASNVTNKIEGRIITLEHRVFVFAVLLFEKVERGNLDDVLYPIIIQLFNLG